MKLNNLDILGALDSSFTPQMIENLARTTNFVVRASRKIQAMDYLLLVCWEGIRGAPSFNDLASRLSMKSGISASKQAFAKRTNASSSKFMQAVLEALMQVKSQVQKHSCSPFKRIIVQDSTVVRLPTRLYDEFSGVSNSHSSVCNARIQSSYDLLSGKFISFSIDPYSKNDLSVASDLQINKGDLTLRDRGYFSLNEVKRHVGIGADCIYRYKHKNIFWDKDGGQIDLHDLLQREASLDMQVCLNNNERTLVRLIAVPATEEIANIRRMKLYKDTNGHSPSKELLELASWSIFITTISKKRAPVQQIMDLYRLRWRIESIFKAWKSNMNFAKIHNVSKPQLMTILIARLIVIVLCMQNIFTPCRDVVENIYKKTVSLMKLIRCFQVNQELIIQLAQALKQPQANHSVDPIFKYIAKYCCYDNRIQRQNFSQIMEKAISRYA